MPPNNFNFGYQQQQMPRNNDVLAVPVNGEAGAQNYPVAAGNTVLLTDFNSGLIWLKTTDVNGMFQQIRTFKVEEITPKPAQADNGNFVSKEEFAQWQQGIDTQLKRVLDYLTGGIKNEPVTNVNAKPATVVPAGK